MKGKKGTSRPKAEQIFEQLEDSSYQNPQKQKKLKSQHNIPNSQFIGQQQEGEIIDQDEYSPQPNPQQQQVLEALNNNQNQQLYQDSSDQDNQRLEQEKKKRQEFWKHKHLKDEQEKPKKPLTEVQIIEMAYSALEKTNKRVMLIRKKNQKRIDDLQKIRMAQQPYLTTSNTHFRGSSSEYSIITRDPSGKTYYHPNHSFRVGQMRLQNFILKNIKQQSTANYLNEVVKFQNYAYQQRKKRRHNIE